MIINQFILVCCLQLFHAADGFVVRVPLLSSARSSPSSSFVIESGSTSTATSSTTQLFGGYGRTKDYSWVEEPFELEISVKVPKGTRAQDILFQSKPRSIDLRLLTATAAATATATNSSVSSDRHQASTTVTLLDGERTMRGRVAMDGTFWEIRDSDDKDDESRIVTVQVEKSHREPKDDFDVIDYDWGGVYLNDEAEVLERKYEEPEVLNVREYAAKLGVDIDNINMSLVDKTMFSSGLNMTQKTLDQLTKSGLAKEVTQQGDGSEFITNEEGEAEPYNSYGRHITKEEVAKAEGRQLPDDFPFPQPAGDEADSSPWKDSIPVKRDEANGSFVMPDHDTAESLLKEKDLSSPSTSSTQGTGDEVGETDREDKHSDADQPPVEKDPIEKLTVKRLKEILRQQGLKVSGNKAELTSRLRSHLDSMMKKSSEAAAVLHGRSPSIPEEK